MLELVITGRHDDYGGADFQDRLCAAAMHNHRLLTACGIDHVFTLVEWNPVPGRALLSEIVRERLPWWHQCLVIDPVWHQRLSTNPKLQFMEFFGKNAAIRRSRADAILTTNSDVFLSSEVARLLATRPLDDRTVYRAVRIDVDRRVEWRTADEGAISDPAWRLRVNDVQPPDYGNSAGDFLLLTRAAWHAIGGFNERVRYAKIHKDGQFCINARLDGYRFEVLGPIYHIDHDGSYANAGDMRGSPDAPYGPEWDYRTRYRNARSWGLGAGIDRRETLGIVHVHHPSTHGPLLSVIPLEGQDEAADANGGLAGAQGRFVAITRDPSLQAFGGRDAVEEILRATTAGIVVPAGSTCPHPTLGAVVRQDTPVIYRRDVVDALVDWDDHEPDAALAFWLRATECADVLEARGGSPARRPHRTVSPNLEARVLARRGIAPPARVLTAAIAERLSAARDVRTLVAQWVAASVPDTGALCAIVGPDWATPVLLDVMREAGRPLAGLFTALPNEEGTCRWGERFRTLAELQALPAGTHVLAGSDPRIGDRLAEAGCGATLHVLTTTGEDEAADAELDALRRAQARDVARGALEPVLARLPMLTLLEGDAAWAHVYDAAGVCERAGRADDAERLHHAVLSGAERDVALRMRATFHAGRLGAARGAWDEAAALLGRVLEHNPDHRAARQILDGIPAATAPVEKSA